MEFAVVGDTFDGAYLATIRLHCKDSTRLHCPAIQKYRAGPTICGVAANVRPGERQDFTDEMDQEQAWLYLSLVIRAVHFYANMFFYGHKISRR
jgi:hypothetical protein